MRLSFLSLLLCAAFFAQAQNMYSYITDKRFKDPSDLVGYNFNPNYLEIPDETENELEPGEYSFGISQNNLYVHGEGISGVYSLNNINPTEYGYKLMLMNARDPRIQGHLKVILNKVAQVDALVFKRSKNEKEMIFYQAQMEESNSSEEEAYFTDRWEEELESADSIWGMQLQPFFRVHMRDLVHERLAAADSTQIRFIEKITTIDKSKKKKKAKKGKDEDLTEDDEKKKLKIVKEYFVEIRSILRYKDAEPEDKNWSFKIKGITERQDDQAGPEDEKYQIEFENSKGEFLYLYLTPDRTISSFEADGMRYLMRGH